jgi:hypothetical protein
VEKQHSAMRLVTVILLTALQPLLADDQSDFSSPPDGSWLRHNPFALISQPASIDFTNQNCRIQCQPPPAELVNTIGPARGGLFAPGVFTDTAVSVDVTDWNPTTINRNLGTSFVDGTFIGVFSRVQEPIEPGNLRGYSASIVDMGPGSDGGTGRVGRLQMFVVVGELSFTQFGGYVDFPLDPARDYRLVLSSRDNLHTARVFDLANPSAPVAERVGTANNFAAGRTGIMILTDRLAPVDTTFDNFLTWDGSPPPLAIAPGSDPGTLAISCDFHRALATDFVSTTGLSDPLTPWLPATPLSSSVAGNQLMCVFPIDSPRRFFRRKSL